MKSFYKNIFKIIEPSSDELRKLMAENGGLYQHAFSKTNVTHIIAINLPDSKIKNLKR